MIDVTCALIIRNQKILVAQNSVASDQAGRWEFPGGKIKPNETPEKCIIREISEELELEISVLDKLQEAVFDYGNKIIRLIPFVCRIENGKIKLNNHQAVEWVTVDELETIDFAAADQALLNISDNISLLKKHLWKQMNQTR